MTLSMQHGKDKHDSIDRTPEKRRDKCSTHHDIEQNIRELEGKSHQYLAPSDIDEAPLTTDFESFGDLTARSVLSCCSRTEPELVHSTVCVPMHR